MAKTEKRWQLLLMADDGRIIPFKRIKGIAVTLVFLLGLLALLCLGLGWQLSVEKSAHRRVLDRLAAANRQVAHYKHEQEMTAAELVLAKARMEKAGLPVARHAPAPSAHAAEQNGTDQEASAAAGHNGTNPAPTAAPTKVNGATAQKPPAAVATAPSAGAAPENQAAAKTPAAKPAKPPVGLGDLEVRYNARKKILRAKLRVKNTGPRSSPVAGRCVVVLKSAHLGPDAWVTLPPEPLVGGRPTGKRGRSFRISNFIDLAFKAPGPADPSAFNTATVYVFDSSGAKMLEKDFSVDLPAPAAQHESEALPVPKPKEASKAADKTTQAAPDHGPARRGDAGPVK